jgi:HD-GYP domain-containing protein (c-di-GMP phosphodiesterase class II)
LEECVAPDASLLVGASAVADIGNAIIPKSIAQKAGKTKREEALTSLTMGEV